MSAVEKLDASGGRGANGVYAAVHAASETATATMEGTRNWVAKRGRASYAGERTIGSLDSGIVAVATMGKAIVAAMDSKAKPEALSA